MPDQAPHVCEFCGDAIAIKNANHRTCAKVGCQIRRREKTAALKAAALKRFRAAEKKSCAWCGQAIPHGEYCMAPDCQRVAKREYDREARRRERGPKNQPGQRLCLKCDNPFQSHGAGNRLCPDCNRQAGDFCDAWGDL